MLLSLFYLIAPVKKSEVPETMLKINFRNERVMKWTCICLLATHKLICVAFSFSPGVGSWLRLLLVALPGLFC